MNHAMTEREVLVLPMNGNRDESVRVIVTESDTTGIVAFTVKSPSGERFDRTFTDEREAFSAAFAMAAWNVRAVRANR